MQENLYQNVDSLQNNPLDNSQNQTPVSIPKKKNPLSDPKILTLFILGVITIVLLITSLIINLFRRPSPETTFTPTAFPSEIPLPTSPNSLIPDAYQDKFKNLENSLNHDLDLEVPAIDMEIGL